MVESRKAKELSYFNKGAKKNDDVQSQKSTKSTASKTGQKNKQVLNVVNQVFAQNGYDKVTNLEKEFSSGSK